MTTPSLDIPLPTLADRPSTRRRLPPWLKRPLPGGVFVPTATTVLASGVATVCEEAKCPNRTECWSAGTATFMVMGDRCTRRCGFCSVATARPDRLSDDEPARLATAAQRMALDHVVITAVARDDLLDEGADHLHHCIVAVRSALPSATIEVLPADLHAEPTRIARVCDARPDVYNHNIETVERLSRDVRPQAAYRRSLDVFRVVRQVAADDIVTKSGIMVGLGETRDELRRTFDDLVAAGVMILTVGQYLQPSRDHLPVQRYVPPAEFDTLADDARSAGFAAVASGPFVRSSYHAGEVLAEVRRRREEASHV
jgi:lipoic acid synthetase